MYHFEIYTICKLNWDLTQILFNCVSTSDPRWCVYCPMESRDVSLGLMSNRCTSKNWHSPSRVGEPPPWQGSPNYSSSRHVREVATREDPYHVLQGQRRRRKATEKTSWKKMQVMSLWRQSLKMQISCWEWPLCQNTSLFEILPQALFTSRSCAGSWKDQLKGESRLHTKSKEAGCFV